MQNVLEALSANLGQLQRKESKGNWFYRIRNAFASYITRKAPDNKIASAISSFVITFDAPKVIQSLSSGAYFILGFGRISETKEDDFIDKQNPFVEGSEISVSLLLSLAESLLIYKNHKKLGKIKDIRIEIGDIRNKAEQIRERLEGVRYSEDETEKELEKKFVEKFKKESLELEEKLDDLDKKIKVKSPLVYAFVATQLLSFVTAEVLAFIAYGKEDQELKNDLKGSSNIFLGFIYGINVISSILTESLYDQILKIKEEYLDLAKEKDSFVETHGLKLNERKQVLSQEKELLSQNNKELLAKVSELEVQVEYFRTSISSMGFDGALELGDDMVVIPRNIAQSFASLTENLPGMASNLASLPQTPEESDILSNLRIVSPRQVNAFVDNGAGVLPGGLRSYDSGEFNPKPEASLVLGTDIGTPSSSPKSTNSGRVLVFSGSNQK